MKVLIVGLGSIGKKHVNALKAIDPQSEIFALRSNRDATLYQDVKNTFSLDEIKLLHIDFGIISNPTSEHKITIEMLLNIGCPLFIEKPIYCSLDILDLLQKVQGKNVLTYIACNLRFLDCIKFIKEYLTANKNKILNEVNVYCGSYLPDWREGSDFRNSYSANPEMGGGVHLDLIHELDYLYWLFGMPKKVSSMFKNQSSLHISSFDYTNYILEYPLFCANVVLNYYRRDTKRTFELVFEDETWNVDLLDNIVACNSKIIFKSEQKILDTYLIQMRYFMDLVINKERSFNTINDAYNVLKIALGK